MPVGPHILCPLAATKSTPRDWTSTPMCGTDWHASRIIFAPGAAVPRTIRTMSSTGLTVPRTFETCWTETIFVLSVTSSENISRSNDPSRRTGRYFRTAPVSSAAICHGTMLLWCSASVMSISSPSVRYSSLGSPGGRPAVCDSDEAIRLIDSVAPLVKTISFLELALTNDATLSRAPSYSSVASRDSACAPLCTLLLDLS
mmetsp:Transcript_33090/g.79054  ORF Transcript_33090/g.79054 Transcript_33090/m.79054 type:complete len:201 (-) Transcript_33090:292-894(-)